MKKKLKLLICTVISAVFAVSCQQSQTPATAKNEIKQVSVQETSEAVKSENVQFIDVRTVEEYQSGHAPKAVNMPLDNLGAELAKLDNEKPVYVICQTGRRSQIAAELMQKNGFTQLYNVKGGTSAWSSANLPLEK